VSWAKKVVQRMSTRTKPTIPGRVKGISPRPAFGLGFRNIRWLDLVRQRRMQSSARVK